VITLAAAERDVLILACAISAGIHVALAPEHYDEHRALGIAFLGSAVVLAVLAVALTRQVSPLALALGGAVLAGLLAGYLLAITVGLPVLHPEPEPVERIAVATKVVEAAGLVAALHLLRRNGAPSTTAFSPKGASA
jgi:hypothetical protein